jgi:uncharacterized repeat protein (TIGR01451 family)
MGTPGQGRAGGVANFSELSAYEAVHGAAPSVARSARPRTKASRTRPSLRPASATTRTDASDFPGADLSFSPASDPPSPAPSASFPALLDDITAYNPDTQGAVGTNHIVTMLSSQVRIQNRLSGIISTVSLNTFWGTVGNSNVYDPRILYDSFAHRWVATAIANPGANNSSLLIAVSQTSDPNNNWFRHSIQVDIGASIFPDSPNAGLTKDWIIVQANTFNETNYFFFSSEIRVFTKASLYAGEAALFRYFKDTNAVSEVNAAVPAVNYDNNYATNFLVSNWDGGNADDGQTFGYLRVYSISGPVGAEVFRDYGTNGLYVDGGAFGNPPWDDYSPLDANFAPQQGTANKIYIGDARIQNVVYRNAALWCAQHVFLPAGAPARCSVQWWAFTTGGSVFQRGRRDDASGAQYFAYPSIAVNSDEDVLIGYSRFGANQFPSANYSFHGYEDGPGSLRLDTVLKAGEASFFVDDRGYNHWGNWSASVVDPLNDTDLWTIQEYAASHSGSTNRWGTWWGRVSPPTGLSLAAIAAPNPVNAGGNVTYSLQVTNNFVTMATGVRVISTLPSGSQFISAISPEGNCSHSNGVVTCTFGTFAGNMAVTASIVAKLNQSGPATNTITALANGPDEEDPADNTVKLVTMVNAAADLAVSLAESSDPVTVSNVLTYTVSVTNQGPSPANAVSLTNLLPAGVTYISANPGQGSCSGNSTVVCTLGTLASAASVNVTLQVRPTTAGLLSNRASVGSATGDPNISNNSTTLETTANAAPTLQAISNRTINEDTVLGPISFTVGDLETPAGSLEVIAFSSNQALVPNGNINLGGSGSSRTITVTPAPNVSGVVNITRVVTDAAGATASQTFTNTIIAVNDPPTITDIPQQSVDEDAVLGPIAFTVGDIETAAGTLTVFGASDNPALIPNGNIQFSPPGSAARTVTIRPATNQFGTATITVTVSDGTTTANDTFIVTVNFVNDLPTISDIGNRAVNEDTSSGAISFTVGDVENAAGLLTPQGTSSNPTLVPNGNITFGGTGANRTVTVRPATNEFGSATITVTIVDLDGGSTNDTFVLAVNPVNDPPTLGLISNLTIGEDSGPQIVTITNLTAGPANEDQNIQIVATSSNPSLIPNPITVDHASLTTIGTLSFAPVANSNGTATITVTVRDAGTSNNLVTRTLDVTVFAVNDAPTIGDVVDRTISEDTSTGPIPIIVGDIDSPLATLSVSGTSSNTELVPNANILTGGSSANPTITITPAPDQSGSATITVFVTDGVSTASDTFVLTVEAANDVPTISQIPDSVIDEDSATNISFTIGDQETLAANLNLNAVSTSPALFSSISFGGADGNRTLNVVPAADQTGTARITVTVSDPDGGSNSMAFDLTLRPVNDPPTLSRPDDVTIVEDEAQQVVQLVGISSGAPNEFQALTVRAESGNPSLIPAPLISYTSPSATGLLTFKPLTNVSGSAVLTVFVSDGSATNTQSFTVTVLPENDLPTLPQIENQTIEEDSTATVNFFVNDAETPVDQLMIHITSSNMELLDETGIVLTGTGTNRSLFLSPRADESGSTFVTVEVTDSSNAVVTTDFELNVLSVNDAPTITGLSNRTVNESTAAITLNIPFTVSDPESLPSALLATASSANPALVANSSVSVTGSGSVRTLNLTVTAGQSGSATISVIAKDGSQADARSTTNTFILRVNALPVLSGLGPKTMRGNTSTNIPFTVTDADSPAAEITVLASSSNQALVSDASLSVTGTGNARTVNITPVFGQSGTSTITLTAQDGEGGSAIGSFVLTVLKVDAAPVISNVSNTNVTEDRVLVVPFTIGDAENPASLLELKVLSSNPTLLPISGMTLGGSLSNRTVTLTPAANRSGVVTVNITVTDTNGGVASDDFVLTVDPINDPPTLTGLPDFTIDEDSATGPLSVTIWDVETAVTNLSLTAISSNTGLVPNANIVPGGVDANRTIVITPAANQSGSSLITLTLADGEGGSTNTSFTITVAPVNDPPTLNPINDLTIGEDSGLRTVALSGISAGGGEVQALTFSVLSDNPSVIPSASVNYTNSSATGVLSFSPALNAHGVALLTVQVSDDAGSVVTRSFLVTATNVNDPPFISNIADQPTGEDTPLTVPFVIDDRETAALSLSLTATSTNTALVATTNIFFNGSGTNRTLTIVPSLNAFGTTLITVTVNDGTSSASDSFLLTVNSINDPPTLAPIINTTVTASGANPTFTVNLTGITSGAANETQTLSITATSTPPIINAITGVISGATGTLTIRPGNNVTGSWLISVTVSDGQSTIVRTFTFTARASANALPTISTIVPQTLNEDTPSAVLPFTVGDAATPVASLGVVAVSTNQTLLPNSNISLGGSGANRTIAFTPAPNQFGTTAIQVTVTDGAFGSSTMTFNVTVIDANDRPTIATILSQGTSEDTPTGPIPVTVGDLETPASALTVTATSGNPALVPNANLLLGGNGANRALIITPATNQTGTAVITVTVSDGASSTNTQFNLTVQPANDPPTISDVAAQSTSEDVPTTPIPFTIGDVETAAANLTLSASSSNTDLVPANAFTFGGSGANRTVTIRPATNRSGTATITLTVSDGTNQVSDTFTLTVNAANDAPTLDVIANQNVALNATSHTVSLTGIGSGAAGEVQTLIVAASSSDPSIIPHPAVNYSSPGATGSLTLAPVRNALGTATITVTVNDGQSQSNLVSHSFTVAIVESGPALRIGYVGGMAVVSWPVENADGWLLQSTANVADVTGWSSVATVPVVVSGRYTVTNAPGSAMRAYRLCNNCGGGTGPTAPTLAISHAGTKLLLSWPAAAGNFVLQETDALAASAAWSAVARAPEATNGRLTVTVDAGVKKFYRLRNQ